MAADWFDPLGLRGSRLDPLTMFINTLRGEGPAQQSADALARSIARRLVGRRVEIDSEPPVAATVERIDEIVPAAALTAMSTPVGELAMWRRVRGRVGTVTVGDRELSSVDIDAFDLRLVGVGGQQIRIEHVDFNATVSPVEVIRWAAEIDGARRVQVGDGRLEVTDRRLARWVWVEVGVSAADQRIVVTPIALRLLGRALPLIGRLRRPAVHPADWLPAALVVHEVRVNERVVGVRGALDDVAVSVDIARLLREIRAEHTRLLVRMVKGGR